MANKPKGVDNLMRTITRLENRVGKLQTSISTLNGQNTSNIEYTQELLIERADDKKNITTLQEQLIQHALRIEELSAVIITHTKMVDSDKAEIEILHAELKDQKTRATAFKEIIKMLGTA